MASNGINKSILKTQVRNLIGIVAGAALVIGVMLVLLSSPEPKKSETDANLTGIVDDASFNEANTQSALSAQQTELESLKEQMEALKIALDRSEAAREKETSNLTSLIKDAASQPVQLASNTVNAPTTDVGSPWQTMAAAEQASRPHMHAVSFHYKRKPSNARKHDSYQDYVPSGTFVRAVVLGGADADASVNGQSKNNGVMLFKLLQPGTLPNGKRSHLQGCFVTASSYGDISSERAYVVLDKLSCAQSGRPIIDRNVTGWAFFGGKVGIKGKPLMRDNKIMQWAGISGIASGIAAAAQYSQSIQSISPLGSATAVPSANIGPYAAYGGATKAADQLSQYYIKRADQYHPVIQVGSGNLVTIVFKDGFYLESEEESVLRQQAKAEITQMPNASKSYLDANADFTVPPEVLGRIDKTYNRQQGVEG